nr:hypothetical protein [Tanacetum cinerariifolium]
LLLVQLLHMPYYHLVYLPHILPLLFQTLLCSPVLTVREPIPSPVREPTPDYIKPPSPPPRSDEVLGGAVLKLVTRVKWLEGLLQQRKQRLVLSDSEGDDATLTEQDIDLEVLHTLASTAKAVGHYAAEVPADATMPFNRRRLRKPFTTSASAHVPNIIPAGADIPAAATT